MEEALYDSRVMRRFVGIDLGREAAPDETTACKFRHLLEQHALGKKLFEGEVIRENAPDAKDFTNKIVQRFLK